MQMSAERQRIKQFVLVRLAEAGTISVTEVLNGDWFLLRMIASSIAFLGMSFAFSGIKRMFGDWDGYESFDSRIF